ncbi:hypothetical protein TVAG_430960 [Trichomonas vaginalis G3]|uniref:Uncharacterized protein n=1 Tax=Trichomonas vaginalis (strain ATCC PRA-98 / G3) TaxID=412133 RepID=A2EZD4_TRIV3|nr:transmembrane protein 151-like protein family [Trichomonas vaginalis G3]EAY01955.1 hypothetical protein TVAG_430960 [Trichomonas vaginalis G3]KAI5523039.1 transmembrane protein 151-like protein family [Trichomonas vaginalis G3]|eukprot:XP_001314465.1 hypothetical protein [Trichomonas vaginalis G3]
MNWPFYVAGALMIPNIIAEMVPLCRKKAPPSPFVFLNCLILNVGFGFLTSLVTGDEILQITSYTCLGVGVFFLIFPFDYCYCKTWFDGWHFAVGEIFNKKLSRQDFIQQMSGNRAIPPEITVTATASHDETRTEFETVTDSDGSTHTETRTYTVTVVTWRDTQAFHYESWQEDSNSIRIKETDVVHAVCTVKYDLDESCKRSLDAFEKTMYDIAKMHDTDVYTSRKMQTPNLKHSITGYICHEEPCETKFYQSCIGRFLWIFFTMIGYQLAYESRWASSGERMRLRLIKRMSSHGLKYRCRYGQDDVVAAESTFRIENEMTALNSPLIMSYETPSMDKSWLKDVPFTSPYQNQPVALAPQQSASQQLYVAPPGNVVSVSMLSEKNEDEKALKDENEMSLKDENEMPLKDENEISLKDENEISLKDENEISLKDENEISLKDVNT